MQESWTCGRIDDSRPVRPPKPSRREFLAASATAAALGLGPRAIAQQTTPPQDLTSLTLSAAADLLRSKKASPVELTQACLKRIDHLNPAVNAYITVTPEQALAAAREMEAEQQRGQWRGPLHGIPIAIKDNIDTAGIRTTAASELFKDRVPAEDAEVVRRLKNAGAILLGKLNLHEFAYGGTSVVTYFGAVHNPWALDRVAGGSSGGPAAAIAAGLCFGSLGTDTAGSVRIPASYCSITGFKPTYGRVSNHGVIPLSWTLDHVGPMTKTVEDAALMLGVIAGFDEQDPTTQDIPVADYARALQTSVAKLRLGLPRKMFFEGLDVEVETAVDEALAVLRKLTVGVRDVTLPPVPSAAAVWGPEIYAYHAQWIAASPEKYQPQTRAAIQRSAGSKAEAYARALRDVANARREIRKSFADVDLLITPTMPTPPGTIEQAQASNNGSGRNTSPFDVFGLPTISIPCGFSSLGLPIGLQVSGAPWAETTVLALAHAYQQATEWHTRRPHLS
jgi:aspartyl-tRNA(Asn)/glutamyl-tRNA(Gln) amidotransferase subunit A